MFIKRCLVCKREFQTRNNITKFCSRKCFGKSRIGHTKGFQKGDKNIAKRPEVRKKLSERQLKDNHWNYKGLKLKINGRWFIYNPTHPFTKISRIAQSRLVAEKCLGHYLTKQEVIHHLNGNKLDDRPKNLYLFASNSIHMSYERSKVKPVLTSNLI